MATLLKLYNKPQINPVQIFMPSSGSARKRPIFLLTDLTIMGALTVVPINERTLGCFTHHLILSYILLTKTIPWSWGTCWLEPEAALKAPVSLRLVTSCSGLDAPLRYQKTTIKLVTISSNAQSQDTKEKLILPLSMPSR